MPSAGFTRVPSSVRMVLLDIAEHPDSFISQIVERTGLPQSLVSQTVARLRDRGAVSTAVDPSDRRRTLVRLSVDVGARIKQAPASDIGPALSRALGVDEPALLDRVTATLTELADLFDTAAQPNRKET